MARIKCTVDDCHYWGEGDICEADTIEVANNFTGGADMEAGVLGEDAGSSNRTQCVTYKPKKKGK
ncbi:MAG: hypothetical protein PWR10_1874 [Halanaerobiales bacterium]|nr:hypothetical protein [Halanaerobiales bacterium]